VQKNLSSFFNHVYKWGDPKIPGIVKKNYLKCLYKFETLVPFEVLTLRLDAAIPALGAVLGLLQPVAGGVLRKGLKFQTCTNTLNIFLTIPGIFGSPRIYLFIYIYIYIYSFTHSFIRHNTTPYIMKIQVF